MNVCSVQPRRRYRFRLSDVICPDRGQVQQQITANLQVSGEVMFMSDKGEEADRFAIVEVEGILSPLIVPVEHLRPLPAAEAERTSRPVPVHHE